MCRDRINCDWCQEEEISTPALSFHSSFSSRSMSPASDFDDEITIMWSLSDKKQAACMPAPYDTFLERLEWQHQRELSRVDRMADYFWSRSQPIFKVKDGPGKIPDKRFQLMIK